MPTLTLPPLSLYVHIPWCVRKCPYCDFNSHEAQQALPEDAYIRALIEDLEQDLHYVQEREIESLFFGGGTPSLFSARGMNTLLTALRDRLVFADDCEITLEANPGTFEQDKFAGFLNAGINRLSLGVQSFQNEPLQALGRIHDGGEALRAITAAQAVGFERINVDLMHGLPQQTATQALTDIRTALDQGISHLSWYQLTIERNTAFYSQPPALPDEDTLTDIQAQGLAAIADYGLRPYEVSAYATGGQACRHNLNYWLFGDYLALGAGAHGKITFADSRQVWRYQKTRLPEHYLQRALSRTSQQEAIDHLAFEFMMNALRLNRGFTPGDFEARTGLAIGEVSPTLASLQADGLLEKSNGRYHCSARGRQFLDDVVARFL